MSHATHKPTKEDLLRTIFFFSNIDWTIEKIFTNLLHVIKLEIKYTPNHLAF